MATIRKSDLLNSGHLATWLKPCFYNLGKHKTAFQITAVIALIIHYPFFSIDFHAVGLILIWIALVFTLWSGADYFVRFLKTIETAK